MCKLKREKWYNKYFFNKKENEMIMKEAFDIFFEKLNRVYEEEFGTKPMIPYSEKWNRDLLVSEPDDEGYVE